MLTRSSKIFLFVLMVVLSACRDGSGDSSLAVHGTVSLDEAAVPMPNWRLVVQLNDVSLADAPHTVLGTFVQDAPNVFPASYSINYMNALFDDRAHYSVSAAIYDVSNPDNPVLLYMSTQSYPVLTNGFGKEAHVVASRITN